MFLLFATSLTTLVHRYSHSYAVFVLLHLNNYTRRTACAVLLSCSSLTPLARCVAHLFGVHGLVETMSTIIILSRTACAVLLRCLRRSATSLLFLFLFFANTSCEVCRSTLCSRFIAVAMFLSLFGITPISPKGYYGCPCLRLAVFTAAASSESSFGILLWSLVAR